MCAEIEISKRQEDTIHKIFLDPTGNHLLACLHGGETYYLHSSAARPKRLLKWSGVVVEAVGFDAQRCTEVRTPRVPRRIADGDFWKYLVLWICRAERSKILTGVFRRVCTLEVPGTLPELLWRYPGTYPNYSGGTRVPTRITLEIPGYLPELL